MRNKIMELLIYELYDSDDCTYSFYSYIPCKGFSSKEELGLYILEKLETSDQYFIKLNNEEYSKSSFLIKGEDIMNRIFTLEEWIKKEGITKE